MQYLQNHQRLRAAIIAALSIMLTAVLAFGTAAITGPSAARTARATAIAQAQATATAATQATQTASANTHTAPHVLAAFMTTIFTGPCGSCDSLTFTAGGPFVLIASCNPFQDFADALPAYQVQLFNSTGHLLDTLQEPCGDPNQDIPATVVIPEDLAAGSYQIQVQDVAGAAPVSVLVLDAAGE